MCFDDASQSWVGCNTPNIFTEGKEVRIRPQIYASGSPLCMKVSVKNFQQSSLSAPLDFIRQIPQGVSGPFSPEINLGTVTKDMFSAASTNLVLASSSSTGCSHPSIVQAAVSSTSQSTASLNFQRIGPNQYKVQVPPNQGISIISPEYTLDAQQFISKAGNNVLSSDELKQIMFNINGIQAQNLIGAPSDQAGSCTYQITSLNQATSSSISNPQKSVSINVQLLQPDLNGACFSASTPVKASGFGKASHTESIILQLKATSTQVADRMHEEFIRGNYNFVQENAQSLINRKLADLEDARALYYSTAAYIYQTASQKGDWKIVQKNNVCNLLNIFFDREYVVDGSHSQPYPDAIKQSGEFEKIRKYMELIAGQAQCSSISPALNIENLQVSPTSTGTSAATSASSSCSSDYNVDVGEAWLYKCLGNGQAASCEKATGKINPLFNIPPANPLKQACINKVSS